MDPDMVELLTPSLERVLTEESDRPLAVRLHDLGWDEVMADDGPAALPLLFDLKGQTLSCADALGPRLAGAMAEVLAERSLAAAAVALPVSLHPDVPSARVNGDTLRAAGITLAMPDSELPVVVPVNGDGAGTRLAVLARGDQVQCAPVGGMDPDLGLLRIEGAVPLDEVAWIERPEAGAAWDAAVAAGRWALAAELLGIGRRVVSQAVAYAGDRTQYGRAIGSFQAVQHRLASAHALVVGASSVVTEAAASCSPWDAKVAKTLAGRAAEEACTQAQQTYGAIGFTWEHEFHRYLRRTYVLDRLLGDWRTLEYEIGVHLRATRDVPRIGVL